MSKELEYLEEIKSYFPFVDLGKGKEYVCEKEFNAIQQALLELQSIKKAKPSEALECLDKLVKQIELDEDTDYLEIRNAHITVEQALLKAEKEHKALEIIKEKRVNVGTFIHFTKVLKKDYEQCKATNDIVFCNICDTEKEFLTEEEFNLLKEVLECLNDY